MDDDIKAADASRPAEAGPGNAAGSGGAQKPTWIEQLPEEMRGDEALYGYRTIGDLVKAHRAAVADLMSERESSIRVPGEGATDRERAEFYARLGRPERPELYNVKKPDALPEGVPYNPDFEAAYKRLAFESGLSDAQASKLWSWYYGLVQSGAEQQRLQEAHARAEAVDSLKNEWGGRFDERREIALRAFRRFGGDEALSLIENVRAGGAKLGDHPAFMRLFHAIGAAVMDDSASPGSGNARGAAGEPDEGAVAHRMFPSMDK